jgi:hypothetical protein
MRNKTINLVSSFFRIDLTLDPRVSQLPGIWWTWGWRLAVFHSPQDLLPPLHYPDSVSHFCHLPCLLGIWCWGIHLWGVISLNNLDRDREMSLNVPEKECDRKRLVGLAAI